MKILVVLLVIVAIAVLAPIYGVDSRGLTDHAGGPPDLLPDDPGPDDPELVRPEPDGERRHPAGCRRATLAVES